jgi:3-methyladenine DNA glycosylase Mpg
VVDGTRIGISRAVELRWRFCAADSVHVSRPRPTPAAAPAPAGARGARARG